MQYERLPSTIGALGGYPLNMSPRTPDNANIRPVDSQEPRPVPANNLRAVRQREGLTITELQGLSQVSTTTIRNLETLKANHSPVIKSKLVNAFNARRRKQGQELLDFDDIFPNT